MDNVFIIAEAGVNHNGDLNLAFKLVDEAVAAGVDAIKFQTFKAENLVTEKAEMADYQKKNIGKEESQFKMLKKLELSYGDFRKLKIYCDKKNIMFLSTPFDNESLDFLIDELEIEMLKISSGELTNDEFLEKAAQKNIDTIISTGMSTLGEVEVAIDIFRNSQLFKSKLTVLHCTTNYPTPFDEVNLNAMNTIRKAFDISVGYSDHTLGIEVPIAAVALGAGIIEKHFTLDKTMDGPDHKASLDPNELKQMVYSIRNIEKALGNGIKKPNKSEIEIMKSVRKSLVINKDIKEGTTIRKDDLAIKRPGTGIDIKDSSKIIGKKINCSITKGMTLKWEYFMNK